MSEWQLIEASEGMPEMIVGWAYSGTSQCKMFSRIENGRLQYYGYRVDYDRDGRECGRTEPSKLGAIVWDDGTPFTKEDALSFGRSPADWREDGC